MKTYQAIIWCFFILFTLGCKSNAITSDDYKNKGIDYYHQKKYNKAIENFTKAVRLNPKDYELFINRGIVFSQKLLLLLMKEVGLERLKAYDLVQKISLKVINNNSTFQQEALKDSQLSKYISNKKLKEIFHPLSYLRNIDKIYKRVGLKV